MMLRRSRFAATLLYSFLGGLAVQCSGSGANQEHDDESGRRLGSPGFWVYKVRRGGHEFEVLTVLSGEDVARNGIPAQALIGTFRRPQTDRIVPEDFVPSPVFNNFLHEIIATYGPEVSELQLRARVVGEGRVTVMDKRTTEPTGEVLLEDIFGDFQASKGELILGSYRRNEKHQLLSRNGLLFQLPGDLQERLVANLKNAAQ